MTDPSSSPIPPKRYRFRPGQRLKHQDDFAAVYNAKAVKHAGPLRVHARPRPRRSGHRLGLSVSRRFGNAVARNTFKRKMREVFRHIQYDLQGDYDWIIVPRHHTIATIKQYRQWFDDAANQLHQLWTRRHDRQAKPDDTNPT